MKLYAIEKLWVLCAMLCVGLAADFYELLDVDRSASTREIRKAFKKLAISAHPDKNTGDPEAHNKFLKITRAYEVLKDEELRKKYDTHGEKGLNNDNRGGHYESWQWYQQNFGIYDEDPEIITLSKSDFEMSVEGTKGIWFINFYSPHCSHCHELAPAWREMARELEGVIRVGAVNCEDDWALCRMQGIHSFPSLLIYPRKEQYHGDRSASALVRHAIKFISASFHRLSKANYKWKLKDDTSGQPWLITFCGVGGDCLEENTCLKLAAMLDGLVKVGMVDCHKQDALCDQMGHHHGTFYFTDATAISKEGMEISSLVAQDIVSTVLHQLPDVTSLDTDTLQRLVEGLKGTQEEAWLVHFVQTQDLHDVELRKLPAMLDGIKVGRVNCGELREQCQALHINKFPSFMTFKQSGGAEVFYGRMTAHDVAAFAQDSVVTPLTSLGPSDFPDRVVLSRDPWFVDFFAPWCPPCMRLLPEFRKAAKRFGKKVNFGTVDCTVHGNLCNNNNINSYPTTIFYNQTEPYHFNGHHSASALVEFIKDTLNPPCLSLTVDNFDEMVANRASDQMWLVDFFAPWCNPCKQLAPEWRRMAKMMKGTPSIHVGQVDCVAHSTLCQQQSVTSYPTIRLYPMGSQGSSSYMSYNGWLRNAESLQTWAYDHLPSKVTTLTGNGFRDMVLGSQQPWLVDFYASWCGPCHVFKPEFEKVAQRLEGKVRAGKVDCNSQQTLCSMAGVYEYPSVRFYQGSLGSGIKQQPFGFNIDSLDVEEIINIVQQNMRKKGHDEL